MKSSASHRRVLRPALTLAMMLSPLQAARTASAQPSPDPSSGTSESRPAGQCTADKPVTSFITYQDDYLPPDKLRASSVLDCARDGWHAAIQQGLDTDTTCRRGGKELLRIACTFTFEGGVDGARCKLLPVIQPPF